MPKLIDLSGRRFGRLTVIKRAESNRKEVYWVCQCDCGNIKTVRGSLLTTKNKKRSVRSCTCLLKERASARQGVLTEKATEANKPFLEFEKGTNIRIISSKKLPKNNIKCVVVPRKKYSDNVIIIYHIQNLPILYHMKYYYIYNCISSIYISIASYSHHL